MGMSSSRSKSQKGQMQQPFKGLDHDVTMTPTLNTLGDVDESSKHSKSSLFSFPRSGAFKVYQRSSSKASNISETASQNPLEVGIPIKVSKKLYFGNMELALVPDKLNSNYGITHILNLANTFKVPPSDSGIVGYKQMVMSDEGETNVSEFMGEALAFIQEGTNKGKVYVHCRLGQNRSVTIILAWLMTNDRLSLADAINLLKEKNAVVNLHPSYIKQLSALELELFGKQTYSSEHSDSVDTITPVSSPQNTELNSFNPTNESEPTPL